MAADQGRAGDVVHRQDGNRHPGGLLAHDQPWIPTACGDVVRESRTTKRSDAVTCPSCLAVSGVAAHPESAPIGPEA